MGGAKGGAVVRRVRISVRVDRDQVQGCHVVNARQMDAREPRIQVRREAVRRSASYGN